MFSVNVIIAPTFITEMMGKISMEKILEERVLGKKEEESAKMILLKKIKMNLQAFSTFIFLFP